MATQIAAHDENPLKKFDAPILKAMGNTQIDAGAPRAMFMPTNMGEAMELAKLMASSNFVPAHLRGKAGDCLAVIMQAGRWGMDPFAVGNKSYFVNDRIAYEAQLVNAVINSSGVLDGKLHPDWSGEGNDLVCTVTGRLKGDPKPKTRRVAIKNITTRNSPLWKQDPEQQIAYYTSRAWVRLHAPEVLLGVYTPDEVEQMQPIDGGALKVEPLTGQALLEQASDDPSEGPSDTDRGEPVTLESAKAEIDGAEDIADVNSRLAALREHLNEDDGDELVKHAGARIDALKTPTQEPPHAD